MCGKIKRKKSKNKSTRVISNYERNYMKSKNIITLYILSIIPIWFPIAVFSGIVNQNKESYPNWLNILLLVILSVITIGFLVGLFLINRYTIKKYGIPLDDLGYLGPIPKEQSKIIREGDFIKSLNAEQTDTISNNIDGSNILIRFLFKLNKRTFGILTLIYWGCAFVFGIINHFAIVKSLEKSFNNFLFAFYIYFLVILVLSIINLKIKKIQFSSWLREVLGYSSISIVWLLVIIDLAYMYQTSAFTNLDEPVMDLGLPIYISGYLFVFAFLLFLVEIIIIRKLGYHEFVRSWAEGIIAGIIGYLSSLVLTSNEIFEINFSRVSANMLRKLLLILIAIHIIIYVLEEVSHQINSFDKKKQKAKKQKEIIAFHIFE